MLQPAIHGVGQARARLRRPLIWSRRFQLGGGLFFAVFLPWMIRSAIGIDAGDLYLIHNTVIANAIAVLIGFYCYQSLTIYPGVQASYLILPTFCAAYALVILGLLFTRLDYNRLLLLGGFVGCLFWFYGAVLLPHGKRPLRIAVVPFGDVGQLDQISRVSWQPLAEPSLAFAEQCDALVADFQADMPEEWERFLADTSLAGVSVLHVKQLRESLTGRVRIDHLSENNFGSLVPARAYLKIKQMGDLVVAVAALVLLLPFLLVVAAMIRLETPGPALFRQRRVGYGGRVFIVYKFRTMYDDDRDVSNRQHAMTQDDDPRVTRLGRFLRRTRIDELPQILNIIRGEMSWIGPRPEAEVLSNWYVQELPFYRYRHIVRPGISGWAQVNQGHVAEVDEVFGKLQYDFYYIRHFSLWLDALIVVRTFLAVVTGFGSR